MVLALFRRHQPPNHQENAVRKYKGFIVAAVFCAVFCAICLVQGALEWFHHFMHYSSLEPWNADTSACWFGVGIGLASISMLMLVLRSRMRKGPPFERESPGS